MIINPTNVRERRKTGYTHDSLQRSHISSPAKNILRRSFYFSFPMKQLVTLLPEMPSSTSHLHKGLVTCGRRHFSWFGGIWLHFFECKGGRLNNIRFNAFCNFQTLGGLPWWGYGTIGAQCSVRHFARVDNALMGCVALSCNILQFCKGLTMPWWRSPPPLRWDLGTCGHSTLHPVLCLHQQYHHQHHHQHHCQLLPMYVLQIKPGIALNSQTCGESWIATEVKVVLNVHQLYHCTTTTSTFAFSFFFSLCRLLLSFVKFW